MPDAVDPDGDATSTWLAGYAFRKAITVQPTSEALVDFDVAVIAADAELATARDDGTDLVFTSVDGKILAHELVSFERSTSKIEAWVRTTTSTAPTKLYLYFGGPPRAATNPWTATAGVWHMTRAPVGSFPDSAHTHDDPGDVAESTDPARRHRGTGSEL